MHVSKKILARAVALIAMAGMLSVGCNKSDDSSDHNPVSFTPPEATPTSSGGTPAAPPQTVTPGVTVEVLESNFEDDRCTQLTDPKYAGLSELFHKAKLTNNSGENIYSKVAIFHSNEAGCGATGANPGGTTGLATGDTAIDNGKTGTVTYHFKIDERACGRYQLDDTWKPTNTFVIGKVINTGIDCPDCTTTNVQVSITGQGLTRNVKVTFQGEKPNKKATVDFGDGTSAQFANGETQSHTWPYGSYTVSASVSVNGLDVPCAGTATVTNNRPTCEDYTAPTIAFQDNTILTSTQLTGSIGATPAGGSWSPAQAFPYERPAYGSPATSLHFDYSVPYGPENLECRVSKGIDKSVPPKEPTCEDFNPPPAPAFGGALALTDQTATQVTVTSGTVAPGGGSFNPGLPTTVNRPAFGSTDSFETNYTIVVPYGPENLRCSAKFSHEYSVALPPQDCRKENLWTLKNQRHDGVYTIVVVTNKNNPSGSIVESFDLGGGQSATFDGYSNQTLHAFYKLPKTYALYWYDGRSGIQNDCEDENGTFYPSVDGRSNVCATSVNHGSSWKYDNDEDSAERYKTTQVNDGYEYHFADSETSGACGAVNAADFEAQWQGDAKLSVSCVCPANNR